MKPIAAMLLIMGFLPALTTATYPAGPPAPPAKGRFQQSRGTGQYQAPVGPRFFQKAPLPVRPIFPKPPQHPGFHGPVNPVHPGYPGSARPAHPVFPQPSSQGGYPNHGPGPVYPQNPKPVPGPVYPHPKPVPGPVYPHPKPVPGPVYPHPKPVPGSVYPHPKPVPGPVYPHPKPVPGPVYPHPKPVPGPVYPHPKPVPGPVYPAYPKPVPGPVYPPHPKPVPGPSIGECVKDCTWVPDGDYQSCGGCNVYASCVGGYLYDHRPCPAWLCWDDYKKRCEYYSSTCDCSAGYGYFKKH